MLIVILLGLLVLMVWLSLATAGLNSLGNGLHLLAKHLEKKKALKESQVKDQRADPVVSPLESKALIPSKVFNSPLTVKSGTIAVLVFVALSLVMAWFLPSSSSNPTPAQSVTPSPTPVAKTTPSPSASPSLSKEESDFHIFIQGRVYDLLIKPDGEGIEFAEESPIKDRTHADLSLQYVSVDCVWDDFLKAPSRRSDETASDLEVYQFAVKVSRKLVADILTYDKKHNIKPDMEITVDLDLIQKNGSSPKNFVESKYDPTSGKIITMDPLRD